MRTAVMYLKLKDNRFDEISIIHCLINAKMAGLRLPYHEATGVSRWQIDIDAERLRQCAGYDHE